MAKFNLKRALLGLLTALVLVLTRRRLAPFAAHEGLGARDRVRWPCLEEVDRPEPGKDVVVRHDVREQSSKCSEASLRRNEDREASEELHRRHPPVRAPAPVRRS